MGAPPAPTYATVFYGVFELFIFGIFWNNLLLYRRFIDNVLTLCKRYDEERDAADLRDLQETMQKWYVLGWTLQGPFLNLNFMDLTIVIKGNSITTTLFEKKSSYNYTSHHIWLTHQESSTESSMNIFTASELCIQKIPICQLYSNLIKWVSEIPTV